MEKRKVLGVLTPTKKSKLIKLGNELVYNDTDASDLWIPQFLHITDPTLPIRQNDWIYIEIINKVTKLVESEWNLYKSNPASVGTHAKVVASMDPILIKDNVPAVSKYFVGEYVFLGGNGIITMDYDINETNEIHDFAIYMVPKLDKKGNAELTITKENTQTVMESPTYKDGLDYYKNGEIEADYFLGIKQRIINAFNAGVNNNK